MFFQCFSHIKSSQDVLNTSEIDSWYDFNEKLYPSFFSESKKNGSKKISIFFKKKISNIFKKNIIFFKSFFQSKNGFFQVDFVGKIEHCRNLIATASPLVRLVKRTLLRQKFMIKLFCRRHGVPVAIGLCKPLKTVRPPLTRCLDPTPHA